MLCYDNTAVNIKEAASLPSRVSCSRKNEVQWVTGVMCFEFSSVLSLCWFDDRNGIKKSIGTVSGGDVAYYFDHLLPYNDLPFCVLTMLAKARKGIRFVRTCYNYPQRFCFGKSGTRKSYRTDNWLFQIDLESGR